MHIDWPKVKSSLTQLFLKGAPASQRDLKAILNACHLHFLIEDPDDSPGNSNYENVKMATALHPVQTLARILICISLEEGTETAIVMERVLTV